MPRDVLIGIHQVSSDWTSILCQSCIVYLMVVFYFWLCQRLCYESSRDSVSIRLCLIVHRISRFLSVSAIHFEVAAFWFRPLRCFLWIPIVRFHQMLGALSIIVFRPCLGGLLVVCWQINKKTLKKQRGIAHYNSSLLNIQNYMVGCASFVYRIFSFQMLGIHLDRLWNRPAKTPFVIGFRGRPIVLPPRSHGRGNKVDGLPRIATYRPSCRQRW